MFLPIIIGIGALFLGGCAAATRNSDPSKEPVEVPKGAPFKHRLSEKGSCMDESEVRQIAAMQLLNICDGRGSMKFTLPALLSCNGGQYSIDEDVTITCKDASDCMKDRFYTEATDELTGFYPLQAMKGKEIEEIVIANKYVDKCEGGPYSMAARFKE